MSYPILRPICWAGLIPLVIWSVAEPSARCEDDPDAIVTHGVELRRVGKDREALAEFQRAAQIRRTPRTVGQIGLAEMALGAWTAAEEHLLDALDHANDPWVQKSRAALKTALATIATHLGTLEVWGTPEGAELLVDGRSVGKLPLPRPLRLPAGEIALTVRASGCQPVTHTLRIATRGLTRENVDLAPVAGPPGDTAAAHPPIATRIPEATNSPTAVPLDRSPGPDNLSIGARPTPDASPASDTTQGRSWKRTLAWIAGGGALIGLGAAVTFTAVGSGNFSDFNRACVIDPKTGQAVPDPQSSAGLTPPQCRHLDDVWKSDQRWAITGYVAGAALAVTSAALFIISSPQSEGTQRSAHIDCRPGLAAIVCGGAF